MTTSRPITLKDIARHADCSVAAVSTVLNNARGRTVVSAETRQRIMDIALSMDYHPNFASRSLKMNRSKTIGIYVCSGPWRQLAGNYEMQIFKGIERATREFGYDLLLLNMNERFSSRECAAKLREHRVDGIIVLHADREAAWLEDFREMFPQLMVVDFSSISPELDTMIFDNAAAVRLAAEHLAELGHHRVGFIGHGLPNPHIDVILREEAFRAAVENFGFDPSPELIFTVERCPVKLSEEQNYCSQEGEQGMRYFLELPRPPTAVICYNDLVGTAALHMCFRRRVRVPEDMSIIGIDNSEFCLFSSPLQTAIEHPLEEMGYHGVIHLLERIDGTRLDVIQRMFSPRLIVRESTGPANVKIIE